MRTFKWVILFLAVLSFTAVIAGDVTAGHISGKLITEEGRPMKRGMVFFFNVASGPPPAPGKYWRVPDEVITIDDDGMFSADLTGGNYYIGVVTGSWAHDGPPRGEDFRFIGQKIDGGLKTYPVKEGEKTDLGLISEEELFHKIDGAEEKITIIEGLVLKENGEPAEKAMALAYPTPEADTQPLFVSDNTGKDGRYTLKLNEGGTYYVKARYRYKARAANEETPVTVEVKTGETAAGIDLKVK